MTIFAATQLEWNLSFQKNNGNIDKINFKVITNAYY